jgi:endonuclease G
MRRRRLVCIGAGLAFFVAFSTGIVAFGGAGACPPGAARALASDDSSRYYAYAGLPKATGPRCKVSVLTNIGYVVGYSEARKDPLWSAYQACKVEDWVTHRRPSRFRVDERTKARVSHDDYTRSGYDRGHMAPNHVVDKCYGREAQLETFLMSNICPQRPQLNQEVWESLEAKVADEYADRYGQVWVTVGPIFDDDIEALPCGVEIPDAFYSILVRESEGKPQVLAFVMPQEVVGDEPLEQFLQSVDEIEKETGLDFEPDLGEPAEVEEEAATVLW